MPCSYDPTPEEIAAQKAAQNGLFMKAYAYDNLLEKHSDLTRMMCTLLSYANMYSAGLLANLLNDIDGLAAWWDEHKKADAERAQREADFARLAELREQLSSMDPELLSSVGIKLTNTQ